MQARGCMIMLNMCLKTVALKVEIWRAVRNMPEETFDDRSRLKSSLVKSSGGRWSSRLTGVKPSLTIGYGLVLVLLLFNGYMSIKKMEEVKQKNYLINNNYALSTQLLSRMQADILLMGLAIRNYLFVSEPMASSYYEGTLREIKRSIDDTSREYNYLATLEDERENWPKLRREVEDYWKAAQEVLALHKQQRFDEAKDLLISMAKKESLFKIANHLISLNRQAAEGEQERLIGIYASFRKNIIVYTAACLSVGFLVAFLASRHVVRLQQEILEQHQRGLENKANLQRLAARLVTAQEEERKAISRELHDEIGQALTAIKINLSMIERKLPTSEKSLHERVAETRSIAEQTLEEVRELSQILRPMILDDLGLIPTLQWYIDKFSKRTGIDVRFAALDIDERLPVELEVHLYRIVQEALSNISRHAQAKKAKVSIRRYGSALQLSVDDDGKGFNPKDACRGNSGRGSGLIGMQERAMHIGGTFKINSSIGRGTHIYVEVPIDRVGKQNS